MVQRKGVNFKLSRINNNNFGMLEETEIVNREPVSPPSEKWRDVYLYLTRTLTEAFRHGYKCALAKNNIETEFKSKLEKR